jgi:TRAP-type C4-dicarboxylate transport system permease large subunit
MFIIVGAMLLGVVLANLRIPGALADMVLAAPLTPLMVMLLIYAIYFVMGIFFDGISMMIITLPVIFPVVVALGYDPVWFGVAFVIIMEVGLLTPPVGLNLYVIHGIAKHRPFSEVAIGSAPFFVAMLVSLAIVHAVPALSLWLPAILLD